MTFNLYKINFLNENVQFISKLFSIQENKEFLQEFISIKTIQKFLSGGKNNVDHVKKMIDFIQKEEENLLYEALVDRLLVIHKENDDLLKEMMKTSDKFGTTIDADYLDETTTITSDSESNSTNTKSIDKEVLTCIKEIINDMHNLCEETQTLCEVKNSSFNLIHSIPTLIHVHSVNIIQMLSKQFPTVNVLPDEKWTKAKRLYETVDAFYSEFEIMESNLSIETLGELGVLYHNVAEYNSIVERQYENAIKYSKKELEILHKIYNNNDKEEEGEEENNNNNEFIGECLNEIGYHYLHLHEYETSLEYLINSLQIFQTIIKIPNKNDHKKTIIHLNIANVLNRIGFVHKYLGNLTIAKSNFKEALKIRKTFLLSAGNNHNHNHNHIDIAESLNNIAIIHQIQGNLSKALNYQTSALEMRRHLFPNGHPHIVHSLTNMAILYKKLGRHKKSIEFYKESVQLCLEIYKNVNNHCHEDVADAFYNLAVEYFETHNYSDALNYFTQALNIYEKISNYYKINNNHHAVQVAIARCLHNIACIHAKEKLWNYALIYFLRSLKLRQEFHLNEMKSNNKDHVDVANSLIGVARSLEIQNDYQQAYSFYMEAREMLTRLFTKDHDSVKRLNQDVDRVQRIIISKSLS